MSADHRLFPPDCRTWSVHLMCVLPITYDNYHKFIFLALLACRGQRRGANEVGHRRIAHATGTCCAAAG